MRDAHSPFTRLRTAGIGIPALLVLVLLFGSIVTIILLARDRAGGDQPDQRDLFIARQGGFDVTVPASGELNALRQADIASQLEVRSVITEIVPEGTSVRKGDVLIRLDDEDIVNRIRDLLLDVDNAEARLIAARSSLRIREESNLSELTLLDVDIRLAGLALDAWKSGEDVSRRHTLELDVETAEKDYQRLIERYEASQRLLEQEFISKDEFARDEIEMIRARSRRDQALLSQRVYLEYDSIKRLAELESALQKAKDRRSEAAERNANEIRNLEREVSNREFALNTARESLARVERQYTLTTITAPQDGLVVYASSLQSTGWGRGTDNPPPQVGTELRRNRTVLVIPDTSQMVAEVKVNEALSGRIRPGQRSIVYSDALPDQALTGQVLSVGVLAEQGNWRDPNRREYTVRIRLSETEGLGLRPSMRCRAEIFVESIEDTVHIPVQAVFRAGGQSFVYRPEGAGYAQHPVRVGRASELYIEVLEGLEAGQAVLLREPTPDRIVRRIEVRDSPAAENGAPAAMDRPMLPPPADRDVVPQGDAGGGMPDDGSRQGGGAGPGPGAGADTPAGPRQPRRPRDGAARPEGAPSGQPSATPQRR
ncbi:MAG: HlyD family efflux transporter periplasmic adaptor subunit [Phycisphaeraceae bacterium]|nr:HlyD family efflux transporter periplasmic adaptor subunit [Phycisphaeraceae bacterium]